MTAKLQIRIAIVVVLAIALLTGCSVHLPGQPSEAERWRAPAEISDFNQLYTQNCAGCHGVDGRLGAASSLNDPLYLAFVTDDAMRQAISKGRIGTNMPAFSEQAGGHLTDQQIELLVTGMRSRWSKPDEFKDIELPRYSVDETGPTSGSSPMIDKSPRRLPKLRRLRAALRLTRPIVRVATEQMAMADRQARSLIRIF